MAQPVALFLESNGTKIPGDSTITSLGREDSIECLSFQDGTRAARESFNGAASGRRNYEPIRFTKRFDKSTPLIAKALCNNEDIKAEFKFFRPSPKGDGTTEHFFTIALEGARIAFIERNSPDCIDPALSNHPPVEEVGLVFNKVIWTYETTGAAHDDSWSEQK